MSAGRTTWRAKPCGWRDRERTVALGDEHGPAGPLVLDVLEELAKEQRGDGTVRTGLRSLSRAAFLPRGSEGVQLARDILVFAARVKALDDLVIADDDDMTVTCRVSGFADDQGRGYESVRKAQQRRDDTGHDGTLSQTSGQRPDGEDAVPVCPPTGQDRTGQDNTSSLRSEGERAPRRKPKPVDPDALPGDLPEHLAPVVAAVRDRLGRIADAKGAKEIPAGRVGRVVADYPDHDHARIAAEVEDYWTLGHGAAKPLRDVVAAYRNRVSSLPPGVQQVTPLRSVSSPRPATVADGLKAWGGAA